MNATKIFPLLLFIVSITIAGTAAFFSVKGIGLLFAGSFLPVVVMASSLELGKLFAVSFLYRKWHDLPKLFKLYLTTAVLLLVGITSLGIFGFLSDAYQDTKNKVNYLDSKITSLQTQNNTIKEQISAAKSTKTDTVIQNNTTTDRYKSIYDQFVSQQTNTINQLNDRITGMDKELQRVKDQPGGLFSNKKKEIEQVEAKQQSIREEINQQLKEIDQNIKLEYEKFLAKVDNLTEEQPTEIIDLSSLYSQLELNEEQILKHKNDIHNTDIGSFRFIADSFDVPVDSAVKWFTIIIVIVFDPLAMILMIGYNMYSHPRVNIYRKYTSPAVIPTIYKK